VNTSWGKYTLRIVLLKLDPRHSNNVDILICIHIIKSICNSVYFRRIKDLWMFLMMGTYIYPAIRFEFIICFFQG